jgi:hypothetical protein
MTGETDGCLVPSSAQPGGREPAPCGLALVQSFINSHYDLEVEHGADLFATASALGRWLLAHRLIGARARVGDGDLERALAVREGLRDLARGHGRGTDGEEGPGGRASGMGGEGARGAGVGEPPGLGTPRDLDASRVLNDAAAGVPVELRFSSGSPRFVAREGGGVADALGLVLALAATAMIDGSWSRLKVCPGDHCDWAFYDHSRNQTGRWCSMSVCGGRAKARSHYRRSRRDPG